MSVQYERSAHETDRYAHRRECHGEVRVLARVAIVGIVESAGAFERVHAHGHAESPDEIVASTGANAGLRRAFPCRVGAPDRGQPVDRQRRKR